MIGAWYLRNAELRPVAEALVPLDDVNFAYGYGVYETLKVRHGVLYFPDMHAERLVHSATVIGLEHSVVPASLVTGLKELVRANAIADANLKVLLIGRSQGPADCHAMMLNPLYPTRHDYRTGGKAITWQGERQYPQAKSLNMLMSSMAFRAARQNQAYDAILVDHQGKLREGTRTNLYFTDGERIFTAPQETVLTGVTYLTLREAWAAVGITIREGLFSLDELTEKGLRGAMLSSTSTKIMPLALIDDIKMERYPLQDELARIYDRWLDAWREGQEVLVAPRLSPPTVSPGS